MLNKFKKTTVLLLIILIFLSLFHFPSAVSAEIAYTGKYMNQGKDIDEIISWWNMSAPLGENKSAYVSLPSLKQPFSAGSLNTNSLQNGLNTINFARFCAGLDSVTLDNSYNETCQAGAFVLTATNQFTHTIPDSANTMGIPDALFKKGQDACRQSSLARIGAAKTTENIFIRTTLEFLDDSDGNNLSSLGHRRWILNPKKGKTGFGSVENISLTYAIDQSNKNAERNYVTWPSLGYFPIELLESRNNFASPWSITLNTKKYGSKYSDEVSVLLKNKNTDDTYIFNKNTKNSNATGEHFSVNNDIYGDNMGYCLSFRKPGGNKPTPGDEYKVVVSGLRDPVGDTVPDIEYDFCFISCEASQDGMRWKKGDINLDGKVDVDDLFLCKKYILKMISYRGTSFKNSDMNDDLYCDVEDFLWIKKVVLKLIDEPGFTPEAVFENGGTDTIIRKTVLEKTVINLDTKHLPIPSADETLKVNRTDFYEYTNWIYYNETYELGTKSGGGFFRVKTDGTKTEMLADTGNSEYYYKFLTYYRDTVVYILDDGKQEKSYLYTAVLNDNLKSLRTGGTKTNTGGGSIIYKKLTFFNLVGEIGSFYAPKIESGWIYFWRDNEDEKTLNDKNTWTVSECKIMFNGTELSVVSTYEVWE